MNIDIEKLNKNQALQEVVSFLQKLQNLNSKKDIAFCLIQTLSFLLNASFSSFVEKDNRSLNVLCQFDEKQEAKSVQDLFNIEMSEKLYDWVMKEKKIASLKLDKQEQFIFIPIIDIDPKEHLEHGMLVFKLNYADFDLTNELKMIITILSNLSSLSMTKLLKMKNIVELNQLHEQLNSEVKLIKKLHRSLLKYEPDKKIMFSVLEDKSSLSNGNLWWVDNLGSNMSLILVGQIEGKGMPSVMIGSYLLGVMSILKEKEEISLKPTKVLKFLNEQLNNVFKSTGVVVNAWYGVFNLETRKIIFSNANFPAPFLIGPEQQVFNLTFNVNEKTMSLGVNLNTVYLESDLHVPVGSKLIICTESLLEQASKIGSKYDPTWLPQVFETLGHLSLSEMTSNLESILSEHSTGTAQEPSRLALLLEIPSK